MSSGTKVDPVFLLHQKLPGLKILVTSSWQIESNPPTPVYTARLELAGRWFESEATSRKEAKCKLSRKVLKEVYGVEPGGNGGGQKGGEAMEQELADRVADMVTEKFDELMQEQQSKYTAWLYQYRKYKVLAGIVFSRDDAMTEMEVVCVTTGTKCVGSEHLEATGEVLVDCHAEILARRCLVHFLYRELESMTGGEESRLLKKVGEGRGYMVKPGVRFHLYISTPPCGDARVFPDRHQGDFQWNNTGVLRTKIEKGEGTVLLPPDQEGVFREGRLLTMSCSDKLARWGKGWKSSDTFYDVAAYIPTDTTTTAPYSFSDSRWGVLGLQGALLSSFLQPAYLHSIVVGPKKQDNNSPDSTSLINLHRAVTGRLPMNLKHHSPFLNMTSRTRELDKEGLDHSVNWCLGCRGVEVVDSTVGKVVWGMEGGPPTVEGGNISRLARARFFHYWLRLCELQDFERREEVVTSFGQPLKYSLAKLRCREYNERRLQLYQGFKESGLGTWLEKPDEQDEFEAIV